MLKGEHKEFSKNCQITSYAIIFGQKTLFSNIKPILLEKRYLFIYSITMLFSKITY